MLLNRILISFGLILIWILAYFLKYNFMYALILFNLPMYCEFLYNLYKLKGERNNNIYKSLWFSLIGIIWLGLYTLVIFKIKSKKMILNLIIICSASDIIQFFGGKYLKKYYNHKPFPSISKNKTSIGYISGIILTPFLLFTILPFNIYQLIFITISGILGDLFASMLKRLINIKDFSNLLGSHGGFLDRFDSLIFSVILLPLINKICL
jgi:CDP-diglyceride synthetase